MDNTFYQIVEKGGNNEGDCKEENGDDDEEEDEGEGEEDLLQRMMELSMEPISEKRQQEQEQEQAKEELLQPIIVKRDFVLLVMIIPTSETTREQVLQEFSFPVKISEVEDWSDLYRIEFYNLKDVDLKKDNWVETLKLGDTEWTPYNYLKREHAYLVTGVSFEEEYEEKSYIPEIVKVTPNVEHQQIKVLTSISELFPDQLPLNEDDRMPDLVDVDEVEKKRLPSKIVHDLIHSVAENLQRSVMDLLSKLDSNTGPYGTFQFNLLHVIIQYNRLPIIDQLTRMNYFFLKANFTLKNVFGRTPVFLAKSMNRVNALRFFEESRLLETDQSDEKGIGLCNLHIVRDLQSAKFSSYDMEHINYRLTQQDLNVSMDRFLVGRKVRKSNAKFSRDLISDIYRIDYEEHYLRELLEDLEEAREVLPRVCLDVDKLPRIKTQLGNNSKDHEGVVKNVLVPHHFGTDFNAFRLEYWTGYKNGKLSPLESRILNLSQIKDPTFDDFKGIVDTLDVMIQLSYILTILHHQGMPSHFIRMSQVMVYTHTYPNEDLILNPIHQPHEEGKKEEKLNQSDNSFFRSKCVFLHTSHFITSHHLQLLEQKDDKFYSYNPKLFDLEDSKTVDGEIRDIYSLCKFISLLLYDGDCPPIQKDGYVEEGDRLRDVVSEVIEKHPIGGHNSHNVTAKNLINCLEDHLDWKIETVLTRKYGTKSENMIRILKSYTKENRARRKKVLYHFTYYGPYPFTPYPRCFPNYTVEVEERMFDGLHRFLDCIDLHEWEYKSSVKGDSKKTKNPIPIMRQFLDVLKFYVSPFLKPEYQDDMTKADENIVMGSDVIVNTIAFLNVASSKLMGKDGPYMEYWEHLMRLLRFLSTVQAFQKQAMVKDMFRVIVQIAFVQAQYLVLMPSGYITAVRNFHELVSNLLCRGDDPSQFRNSQDMVFKEEFMNSLEVTVRMSFDRSLALDSAGKIYGMKMYFVLFRAVSNVCQGLSLMSHMYFDNFEESGGLQSTVKKCFEVFCKPRLTRESEHVKSSKRLVSRYPIYVDGVKRLTRAIYHFLKFESGYIPLLKNYFFTDEANKTEEEEENEEKKVEKLVLILERNELFFNREVESEEEKVKLRMILVSLGAMLLDSEDWMSYKKRKFTVLEEDPFVREEIVLSKTETPSNNNNNDDDNKTTTTTKEEEEEEEKRTVNINQNNHDQNNNNNNTRSNGRDNIVDFEFLKEIPLFASDWETEHARIFDLREDLKVIYQQFYHHFYVERNNAHALEKINFLIKNLSQSDVNGLYFRVKRADVYILHLAGYSDALVDLKHVERFLKDQDYNTIPSKIFTMNARFWLVKGYCCRKLRFSEQAVEDLQQAVQIDPKSPLAYFQLGQVYFEIRRDFHMAIMNYNECVDNIHKETKKKGGDSNEMSDMQKIMMMKILFRRAECYKCVRQPKLAVEDMNSLINNSPIDPTFHFHRGKILLENLNDFNGAIGDFNQTLRMVRTIASQHPGNLLFLRHNEMLERDVLFYRCRAYLENRMPKMALEDINELIERQRRNGEDMNKDYFFERAKVKQALRMYDEATADNDYGLMLEGDGEEKLIQRK